MKKKLLIALVALLVAAFTLGMTAAFADDQKPWAPADSNVTLTGRLRKGRPFYGHSRRLQQSYLQRYGKFERRRFL